MESSVEDVAGDVNQVLVVIRVGDGRTKGLGWRPYDVMSSAFGPSRRSMVRFNWPSSLPSSSARVSSTQHFFPSKLSTNFSSILRTSTRMRACTTRAIGLFKVSHCTKLRLTTILPSRSIDCWFGRVTYMAVSLWDNGSTGAVAVSYQWVGLDRFTV